MRVLRLQIDELEFVLTLTPRHADRTPGTQQISRRCRTDGVAVACQRQVEPLAMRLIQPIWRCRHTRDEREVGHVVRDDRAGADEGVPPIRVPQTIVQFAPSVARAEPACGRYLLADLTAERGSATFVNTMLGAAEHVVFSVTAS